MAYDSKKDEELGLIDDGELGLEVSLRCYDSGKVKVQISRYQIGDGGEKKYAKVGRLALSEMDFVVKAQLKLREDRNLPTEPD